jgi:hypothetical protein
LIKLIVKVIVGYWELEKWGYLGKKRISKKGNGTSKEELPKKEMGQVNWTGGSIIYVINSVTPTRVAKSK